MTLSSIADTKMIRFVQSPLASLKAVNQHRSMSLMVQLRTKVRAGRKRGARWVRLIELARLLGSAEGLSVLWTGIANGRAVHQTTPFTCEERYPELFDLVAELAPAARRILSFGCSSGEELISLRLRFPMAEIVGAEINGRSRRLAVRRTLRDVRTSVVDPDSIDGAFDVIFALAVLQREPHRVVQAGQQDISRFYPFSKFDTAVVGLAERLTEGGLLCVMHAQYRVEDSSAADKLRPLPESPRLAGPIFAPDGKLAQEAEAHSVFSRLEVQ